MPPWLAGRDELATHFLRPTSGILDRPTVLIQPESPILLDEVFAHQKFAGGAIQDVEEAVAIGPEHHFALLALPVDIGEDRNLRRIPVVFIARRELEIPFQLSGVRIESDTQSE